jgi:hypothetical protein
MLRQLVPNIYKVVVMVRLSQALALALIAMTACQMSYAQQTVVNVQQTNLTTTTTTTTTNANGTTSTQTNLQINNIPNIQAPVEPTSITRVPNDAQRIREQVLGVNRSRVPADNHKIVARDPRYNFSGRWWNVRPEQTQVAMLPGGMQERTYLRVIPRMAAATTGGDIDSAQIMPTVGATYSVNSANEMLLRNGAMLVKGGKQPFHVLMPIGNDTAVVRIEEGTFAMVSNFGEHVSVANLADTHRTGCLTLLTDRENKKVGEVPARIGQMLEIYPNSLPAGENRDATYISTHQLRLSNGLTVETMRLNYPHTMKRFNLTAVLSDQELKRVVKTAAAVSYLDRDQNVL